MRALYKVLHTFYEPGTKYKRGEIVVLDVHVNQALNTVVWEDKKEGLYKPDTPETFSERFSFVAIVEKDAVLSQSHKIGAIWPIRVKDDGEWRSVKKSKPTEKDEYFAVVSFGNGVRRVRKLYWNGSEFCSSHLVTHWMPIPTLPEDGDE